MPALIAGGMLGGALISSRAGERAAETAAAAAEFDPRNLYTSLGQVTVDPTTGAITTGLSPELQAQQARLFGLAGQGFDAFQTFDPVEAGRLFTQQLTDLAAPQEQAERLGLENRLFQQGLMSSTTGIDRSQALQQVQNMAHQQRVLTGLQHGQGQQQRLFEQGLQALQAGTALGTLEANLLSPFAAIGGAQTAGNVAGAGFQFQAGMNTADAISSFFGGLGGGLTNLAYGGYSPNYTLNAPPGGTLDYTSGGYGGTGLGVWYD